MVPCGSGSASGAAPSANTTSGGTGAGTRGLLASMRLTIVFMNVLSKAKRKLARSFGYRDPESQASIESWFGKLKERLVWRSEFETLDQARKEIAAYIDDYYHRPHSGLRYRTPAELRTTWEDGQALANTAA